MVITPEGVIDHAGNLGIGLIRWKEIRQIRTDKKQPFQYILIELKKPESLKHKTVNPLQKNLMETNIKLHGTPVAIQASNLAINPGQLLSELQGRL
ncbi:MAG: hypothetical protein IPJ06_14055 [Saprospiraceae bacterium]|nr:hypothetical protein [Saprospiraceae bacterium]